MTRIFCICSTREAERGLEFPRILLNSMPINIKLDWYFDKGDLSQVVYYMVGPDKKKVCAIIPNNITRPIAPNNALLLKRAYKTGNMEMGKKAIRLDKAFAEGKAHALQYWKKEIGSIRKKRARK